MALNGFLLAILLLQGPGDGWTMSPSPAREVKRVYWDLFRTTEVWLRLEPDDPSGKPPLVQLVFQAFFPGAAERDPYSGNPRWPGGTPERLVVRAQPLPLTLVKELSLRLRIDDRVLDLTAPGSPFRNLPCLIANEDCTPNAVEAEIQPSTLRSLLEAHAVGGEALGFPFRLTTQDQVALADFAERINLSGGSERRD
jgi:hypothetical protein